MHSVLPESAGGPSAGAPQRFMKDSTSLPFGQHVKYSSIQGSGYLTAQTLIQQVAYALSDRVFAFPDDFELDIAVQRWANENEPNAHGYPTPITSFQTRNGAASAILGYLSSADLDAKKKASPHTVLSSSSSVPYLRSSLEQLAHHYNGSSPLTAHIAAIDYHAGASDSLASNYASAIETADNLGYGIIASLSAFETQHIALLATIISRVLPTLHIYDGITVARETFRAGDVLDQQELLGAYDSVSSEITNRRRKAESEQSQVQRAVKSLNAHLGTAYQFFEYEGHPQAEHILVIFGTIESAVSTEAAAVLARKGEKVGVVLVRVYRPFIEEEFLQAVPQTAKYLLVLGQVRTRQVVHDAAEQSRLFEDVLATVNFSTRWHRKPLVDEIKYASVQNLDPAAIISTIRNVALQGRGYKSGETVSEFPAASKSLHQYIFWDTDDSESSEIPYALGRLFSFYKGRHVSVKSSYDNLVQGGLIRTDVRDSASSLDAPYPISGADIVYVGNENILAAVDVVKTLRAHGSIVLRYPGLNKEDLEKKLPLSFRKSLAAKPARLFILDPSDSPMAEVSPIAEPLVVQLAILKLSRPDLFESSGVKQLSYINSDEKTLEGLSKELETTLWSAEVLESWAKEETEKELPVLPHNVNINSFAPFSKEDPEEPSKVESWEEAAKALAFKEAYSTEQELRPDLPTNTYTVHVKENRRVTPTTYDRNIFHIEFDVGDSGLKYQIGEALGIHAENDPDEVSAFIDSYGLSPTDIVQVPSLKDPRILESRTVSQSLLQNIDIFGRPPKKFYSSLAEFATDPAHKSALLALGGPEGATEFKRRAEVDTCTFADVLFEFPSAHPSFPDLAQIVSPAKRREYSIASSQAVTPTSVALLIVLIYWEDTKGRKRYGQATRYLQRLPVGHPVTVSVKPSVMKLPTATTAPIILAGLGTGLAPFRAFVQHRAYQRDVLGLPIGPVLLYMGSRHQREEYLYGEEWEAYRDAGVVTLLGRAFSRDQPQKIYIQDRMRETLTDIVKAYLDVEGAFYLCGPTWPVPDVTKVLEEAIDVWAKREGKKIRSSTEIQRLKEDGRYVLEVY